MFKLFWLLIPVLLLGCESPVVNRYLIEVTFSHTHLFIPKQYILPGLSNVNSSQSLDKDVGVLLKIPLQDLGYPFGAGINAHSNLTLLLTPLSIHHSPKLPPSALAAWKGYGFYKDRIIEFDKVTQLYRIYSSEYKVIWEFFNSYPESSVASDKEWVAGCLIGPLEKEAPNLSNVTCDTVFLYRDIHIEMSFSGMYINKIGEFKYKIRKLFESWEQM